MKIKVFFNKNYDYTILLQADTNIIDAILNRLDEPTGFEVL
jgi:hypothetical protein